LPLRLFSAQKIGVVPIELSGVFIACPMRNLSTTPRVIRD
jgi:hypothetical protein